MSNQVEDYLTMSKGGLFYKLSMDCSMQTRYWLKEHQGRISRIVYISKRLSRCTENKIYLKKPLPSNINIHRFLY